MRAVIDTVVLVRALINPHSPCGRILLGDLAPTYTLLLSPDIVEEILDVLSRPALRQRFPQMASPPHIQAILRVLEDAEVIEPRMRVHVCRDPNDDKFLECALAGGASYIVSEDRDLLDMEEFQKVKIVDAAQFCELLASA